MAGGPALVVCDPRAGTGAARLFPTSCPAALTHLAPTSPAASSFGVVGTTADTRQYFYRGEDDHWSSLPGIVAGGNSASSPETESTDPPLLSLSDDHHYVLTGTRDGTVTVHDIVAARSSSSNNVSCTTPPRDQDQDQDRDRIDPPG